MFIRRISGKETNCAKALVTKPVVVTLVDAKTLRGNVTNYSPPTIIITRALRNLDRYSLLVHFFCIKIAPALIAPIPIHIIHVNACPVYLPTILPAFQRHNDHSVIQVRKNPVLDIQDPRDYEFKEKFKSWRFLIESRRRGWRPQNTNSLCHRN